MKAKSIWICGMPGSGKTTLGAEVTGNLNDAGINTFLLDGDVLRSGLCVDLGYSVKDRYENIRRAAELAKLLNINDINVIATFISPTEYIRKMIRSIIQEVRIVFLDIPLEICEKRDTKGLYKKAREGLITDFTGISSPFEPPLKPDLKITEMDTIQSATHKIINLV